MSQKVIRLILDFDGTLTKQDTLHLVAEAGYQRQKAMSDMKELPPWQQIVDAYLSDYEGHRNKYHPQQSERTTVLDESLWLNSLEAVEKASAERVKNTGVFDHVTTLDVENAAIQALKSGKVELRPGWADLLVAVRAHNSKIDGQASNRDLLQVISVNWSRWFIWSVLWKAAHTLKDPALAEQVRDAVAETAIFANEIDSVVSDSRSSSTPSVLPRGEPRTLRTSGDKARLEQTCGKSGSSRAKSYLVYIGDSATDLECLVMADIGICMRDQNESSGQKELVSICKRIGIALKHLEEYAECGSSAFPPGNVQSNDLSQSHTIYYAVDFEEVVRFVRKLSCAS